MQGGIYTLMHNEPRNIYLATMEKKGNLLQCAKNVRELAVKAKKKCLKKLYNDNYMEYSRIYL